MTKLKDTGMNSENPLDRLIALDVIYEGGRHGMVDFNAVTEIVKDQMRNARAAIEYMEQYNGDGRKEEAMRMVGFTGTVLK